MTLLVSVSDLSTYMDITFSLRQQDAAEFVLEGLQSELEAYLRRPITLQSFSEEYTLPSDHVGMPTASFFYNSSLDTTNTPLTYINPPTTLAFRNSPVTSVTSVMVKNYGDSGTYMGEAIERTATVTNVTTSGTNATFTTSSAHKFTRGQYVSISGMIPDTYNCSSVQIDLINSTTSFTINLGSNLGTYGSSITAVDPVTPSASYARYTTSSAHGLSVGSLVTISGLLPTAYNGDYEVVAVPSTTTFTVSNTSAAAVTDQSGTVKTRGTAVATGNDYIVRRFGIDFFRGYANDTVVVDYEAGLDGTEIGIFKLLILRAATREMQNMHDDVVGVKDLEPRNVAPLETGFSERELMSVKKYRRNRVA